MRTITFFALFFLFFFSLELNAQSKVEKNTLIEKEHPEVKAEIQNLVHELYQAIKEKDLEKMKSFHVYSDKFSAFYGGRKRKNSEEAQEYERKMAESFSEAEFDIEDVQVNVFDNVAVATFYVFSDVVVNGEKRQGQGQITLVYVNIDGEWKITHEHVSSLTEGR